MIVAVDLRVLLVEWMAGEILDLHASCWAKMLIALKMGACNYSQALNEMVTMSQAFPTKSIKANHHWYRDNLFLGRKVYS